MSALSGLGFAFLLAFVLYRRFKGALGRQPLAPRRMMLRMGLLLVVCVLFLVWLPTPLGFAAAAAGGAIGLGLALLGLAHTKFERTDAGAFYTPNTWIGLTVTALFLGRLAARMVTLYELHSQTGDSPFAGMPRSPLTLGLYFLLAGYYIVYDAGVLHSCRSLLARSGLPTRSRTIGSGMARGCPRRDV